MKIDLCMCCILHCDLLGLAPILCTNGYIHYAIFVYDFSRFTWFYPLKHKSYFAPVLKTFLPFVQTQFSCKVKVFQSDGGTEFSIDQGKTLFSENGTDHPFFMPLYT